MSGLQYFSLQIGRGLQLHMQTLYMFKSSGEMKLTNAWRASVRISGMIPLSAPKVDIWVEIFLKKSQPFILFFTSPVG